MDYEKEKTTPTDRAKNLKIQLSGNVRRVGRTPLSLFQRAIVGIKQDQKKTDNGHQNGQVTQHKIPREEIISSQTNSCTGSVPPSRPQRKSSTPSNNDLTSLDSKNFLLREPDVEDTPIRLSRSFSAPTGESHSTQDRFNSRSIPEKDAEKWPHDKFDQSAIHAGNNSRDQHRNCGDHSRNRSNPQPRRSSKSQKKNFSNSGSQVNNFKKNTDNFSSKNSNQQSKDGYFRDQQDSRFQGTSSTYSQIKNTVPQVDDHWEDVEEVDVDSSWGEQGDSIKESTRPTLPVSVEKDTRNSFSPVQEEYSQRRNVVQKGDVFQISYTFREDKDSSTDKGTATFQDERCKSSSKFSHDVNSYPQHHDANNYKTNCPRPEEIWDDIEDENIHSEQKKDSNAEMPFTTVAQHNDSHTDQSSQFQKHTFTQRTNFKGNNSKKSFTPRENRGNHEKYNPLPEMTSASRSFNNQHHKNSNYRDSSHTYNREPSITETGQSLLTNGSNSVVESDIWEEVDQSELERQQMPEINSELQDLNNTHTLNDSHSKNVTTEDGSDYLDERLEGKVTSEFYAGSSHDTCTSSYSPLSPSSDSSVNKPGEISLECESTHEQRDLSVSHDQAGFSAQHIASITKLLKKTLNERGKIEIDVQKVKDDINRVLFQYFEGCKVEDYGSQYSGYALNTSNINLDLVSELAECMNKKYLKAMADQIEKSIPDYFVFIEEDGSRYQVSCIEPQCGASCDIAFLGKDSLVVQTSKMIKQILMLDVRVKPLVIGLRHWAEVCSIHEPEKGSLHALALVLMTIYFLQRHDPPVLPVINVSKNIEEHEKPKNNKVDIGVLWIHLLKFYAQDFNWRDQVVSITTSETVSKKDKAWKKYWIAIEDPANPKINVAKNVSSQDVANYIQSCFSQSYGYFSKPPPESSMSELSLDDNGWEGDSHSNFQKEVYEYSFDEKNLAGKISMLRSCFACEELGDICEDCIEEEENILQEFPALSAEDMEPINIALREAYDEHALKEEDIKKRLEFVANLERYIKNRYKDAKLELIGSSMNGFGFNNSDLDICMTFEGQEELPQDVAREIIKNVCYHLRRNKDFNGVFALHSAKIPIVAFHHIATDFRGDISLYNILACYNTNLIRTYSEIDERARMLGFCLKLVAKKACIADTAQKSLSSYSYVLMAIHFLQRTDPPVLPALQQLTTEEKLVEECNVAFLSDLDIIRKIWNSKKNKASLAELWLEMLRYYIMDIDVDHVISIRHGNIIPKTMSFRRARMFSIEDPFISIKNLGSVMSEQMSVRTYKAFVRARKLFGTPLKSVPAGCQNYQEYYFDSMSLTDGLVVNIVECNLCGKQGHLQEKCGRYNINNRRGRRPHRGAFRGSRGGSFNSSPRGSPRGSYRGGRSHTTNWVS